LGTVPIFSLLGSPDPFGIPTASRSKDGAGGVFVIKLEQYPRLN
jgi:hypothetical protein